MLVGERDLGGFGNVGACLGTLTIEKGERGEGGISVDGLVGWLVDGGMDARRAGFSILQG